MENTNNIIAKPTSRNSAFELLRIIAIFLIIAHHFSVHGGFEFAGLQNSGIILLNRIWIDFIAQFGRAGVNLFVLISAFFLSGSTHFKTKKVLLIISEMVTFSLVFGVVFLVINHSELSISSLISIIFPFGSATWWFMTYYLLMYLFSPLLNLAIKSMGKKMHLAFVIILLILWSFLPTLLKINYGFTNFGWFITLYLVASFINIYDVNIRFKSWLGILLAIGIFISSFLIMSSIEFFLPADNYFSPRIITWFKLKDMNNIFQVVGTIILFLSFKKLHLKSNVVVNYIASTTLAIYLFHDHNNVRDFLWIQLFKNSTFASSTYLIPYSIGVIIAVFLLGFIVGVLYRYSLYIGFNKVLSLLDKKILYKFDNIFNNLQDQNRS